MPSNPLEEEFLKVYHSHADAIYRYCYFRLYSKEKAHDMAQEAFMKVWQYLSEGKKVDNLRAFLYKVTNNLIIDSVRKKKESSLDALAEDGFEPVDTHHPNLDAQIDGILLTETLQSLSEEYRDVIYMRYIDNLQPREIAEVLGESVNIISVRIHRGLKKLKQIMEEKEK